MKKIDFSYNWNNKLSNKCFTSIRRKEWLCVGDIVEIYLNGKYIMKAQVIEKQTVALQQLRKKEYICRLDTGYSAKETCEKILPRMYDNIHNNSEFIVYLFKEVSREGGFKSDDD